MCEPDRFSCEVGQSFYEARKPICPVVICNLAGIDIELDLAHLEEVTIVSYTLYTVASSHSVVCAEGEHLVNGARGLRIFTVNVEDESHVFFEAQNPNVPPVGYSGFFNVYVSEEPISFKVESDSLPVHRSI